MNTEDYTKSFLDQLYNMTGGDMENQASMYEVGSNIGLDRGEAGSLGEDLMVQGLVELKTLAGGVSLTQDGLKLLGISSHPGGGSGKQPRLSSELFTTQDDLGLLEDLLTLIRNTISTHNAEFTAIEELVIDLKTIEVQLLSPKPKNSVIRPLLQAIAQTLQGIKADTAATIATAVS